MKKTLLRGVIVSMALAVTGVTARAQSTTPPANGDIRSDRRDIRQDTRDIRSDRRDLRSDVIREEGGNGSDVGVQKNRATLPAFQIDCASIEWVEN